MPFGIERWPYDRARRDSGEPGGGYDHTRAPVSRMRVASVAAWTCAVLVTSGAAQVSVPTTIWQRIRYPPVTLPGTGREHLTFLVSSGGHKTGPREEPSHLRLDVMWAARDGVSRPEVISGAQAVVVKLHTADGEVVTRPSSPDWLGVGNGGWTTWSLTSTFPWSRNALDETWFEVRAGGQTWWIELPYGFARNPEDAEVLDHDRDVPRFPATMQQPGVGDILVPWLGVEYEIGRIHNGALLSVNLSNPFDARTSVVSYREPPMQVGPDTSRQNLDTPRIAVGLEAAGRTLTGRELARRLSDDRHTRTDDFTFDRTAGLLTGRAFGTVTVSIDDERYGVRVPSSVFAYIHGRTDPENKHWMAESR
jgi:hypothetical protein